MSKKLPESAEYTSANGRKIAAYCQAAQDIRPAGLQNKPVVYRIIRTERTRRGFGTIIHTLTTFTANRKDAARLVRNWVQ